MRCLWGDYREGVRASYGDTREIVQPVMCQQGANRSWRLSRDILLILRHAEGTRLRGVWGDFLPAQDQQSDHRRIAAISPCSLLQFRPELCKSPDHPSRLSDLPIADPCPVRRLLIRRQRLQPRILLHPCLPSLLTIPRFDLGRVGVWHVYSTAFPRSAAARIGRRRRIRRVGRKEQPPIGIDEQRCSPSVIC